MICRKHSVFCLGLEVSCIGCCSYCVDCHISFSVGRAYGYSSEDVQMVIETMASQGKEPTFCMGDDIPLAVLSRRPHMLYDYFKQRFAQVCNIFMKFVVKFMDHSIFDRCGSW